MLKCSFSAGIIFPNNMWNFFVINSIMTIKNMKILPIYWMRTQLRVTFILVKH